MSALVVYDDVTFSYPGATAPSIAHASLSVAAGEMLLVAGPSGAGKSTLLRMANGLVPHHCGGSFAGSVTVAGRNTREHKPRDLADIVGFVAQDPDAGSISSTVEDDIAFVLENLGVPQQLMRKRVEETLDALAIAHLRERRLETLSGGERQRVAIASVLVAAPQLIVADEPTSQLDPQSAEEVLQTVLRLSHELGIGVMLAEHRLERVASFADRACIVEGATVRAGDVRAMLADSPVAPPVVRLARALRALTPTEDHASLPLSVREAREMLATWGAPQSVPLPVVPGVAAPGEPRILIRRMRIALGGKEVVRVNELAVAAGEVVAVVGRNGAGKTTLLRAIAGLIRRAAGEVLLDGTPRGRVEDAARTIAFIPQNASRMLCLPRAIDEIATTLRLQRLDPSRAPHVLEEWGMSAFADRDPNDLSAGEATWLALAAACAADPPIVLLDEPTRGMDELGKQRLTQRLASWAAQGRAIIIVTHDVELVAQVATRVVMMSDGEVVIDGPVRDVLGESVMFSSQMNKVFRDARIATVADAVAALTGASA